MASTLDVSRYHALLLSVAAIAATSIGIYALYRSHGDRPSTGLHRSNAVHRQRRDRTPLVEYLDPTPESPLGSLLICRGDRSFTVNITDPEIAAQELGQFISSDSEEGQSGLVDAMLGMGFAACLNASTEDLDLTAVQTSSLTDLLAAMAARDEAGVRLHSHTIRNLLRLDSITDEQIESAVATFLESERWTAGSGAASRNANDLAETEELDLLGDAASRSGDRKGDPSQSFRGLLYYIAEGDAKRKAYEHRGFHCEECGEMPIRGVRWHCLNCPDFDLCSLCEDHTAHPKTHVFAKVTIPLPVLSQPLKMYPIWYPGDPVRVHGSLDAGLKKSLCDESGFEDPQMDALYDQFTCVANVSWPSDASGVNAAIDRHAFNRAFTCERWPQSFANNILYDRMFAFYDTDDNGLIGFSEFVSGLAYLRGPSRFASLEKALRGFDMDEDGFLDRKDFLRLLRAKFDVQKELIKDMINGQKGPTPDVMETLASSQPISSIFADEDIPPGQTRRPRDKHPDSHGDRLPIEGTRTILEDDEPWVEGDSGSRRRQPSYEVLRTRLSRFEELLDTTEQLERDEIDDLRIPSDQEILPSNSPGIMDMIDFDSDNEIDRDRLTQPHVQDILWQISEEGLNELLDPLFKSREVQDQEVLDTAAERHCWRQEIEIFQATESATDVEQQESRTCRLSDAVQLEESLREETVREDLPYTNEIVPTDWESLERRERQIPNASLDQLLDAAGYGVRDGGSSEGVEDAPQARGTDMVTMRNSNTQSFITSQSQNMAPQNRDATSLDLTLPQHMQTATPSTDNSARQLASKHAQSSGSKDAYAPKERPARPPSPKRLRFLTRIESSERQMRERGGSGRLSYYEIEAAAVRELRGDLRGLIKSWLEWASF